jgi:uncharacterized protein YrrD
MLHALKDLKQFGIRATDGDIGKVTDVYFDDERWGVRYLVVDTGNWLPGRQVLISPFAVNGILAEDKVLTVSATKQQIEGSPDASTHQPISRQFEAAYSRYYGYPFYWGGTSMWGTAGVPQSHMPGSSGNYIQPDPLLESGAPTLEAMDPADAHLRSSNDVKGYHIDAQDGDIGHVDDFLVDAESWAIRYLVVDTSNWWFGNKVLVSPQWVEAVSWAESKAVVSLTRDAIQNAPGYDPDTLLDRDKEIRLHEHYGRKMY